MIFPDLPRVPPSILSDDCGKSADVDSTNVDDESGSECDNDSEHSRVCLVCHQGISASSDEPVDEADVKLRRQVYPLKFPVK